MDKDQELRDFASGTRRFEPSPKATLKEALTNLGKQIRARPYRRTEAQIEASVRVSQRIMGERDE